ncbi:hypothetical protein [Paraflavitalea pollutisoli]|uniref:hypothetical protein n=1 Tax=Paraflavitalea pollutisoli TaxID=3034143 RepID=UPI0023EAEB9E|nr:hypothetical protein [Paraflavitalea sp. H1-2-19X]
MKLSEFIVMNEAEKKRAVSTNAVAIAKRTSPGLVIFLFQIDNFYVEAYCNTSANRIEEYCVLPDTNAIGHYLESIPIDGLFG